MQSELAQTLSLVDAVAQWHNGATATDILLSYHWVCLKISHLWTSRHALSKLLRWFLMLVLLYRCLRRPFVGEFVTQKSRRCSIFPARTGGILLMSSTLKAQWQIQRSFQHVSAWRNVIWSKSPLLRPSRQMMGRGLLNWWSAKCVVSPCSFHGALSQNKYPCPGCLNGC